MPAVRESFGKEGSDVVIDASPAVFSRFVAEEIARDDRIEGLFGWQQTAGRLLLEIAEN
jgi:hypothetical protein